MTAKDLHLNQSISQSCPPSVFLVFFYFDDLNVVPCIISFSKRHPSFLSMCKKTFFSCPRLTDAILFQFSLAIKHLCDFLSVHETRIAAAWVMSFQMHRFDIHWNFINRVPSLTSMFCDPVTCIVLITVFIWLLHLPGYQLMITLRLCVKW